MRRLSWSSLPGVLAAAFLVLFLAAPVGAMLLETVWGDEGFSLRAYAAALPGETDWVQMGRSLALGVAGTSIAAVLGLGHAWLTHRTDLPGAGWLGPLGVAPLVVPPIFVAMGFTDLVDASGFGVCALLLGVSYAPFVAVLAGRGLRAVDGRTFEAAQLSRGALVANRNLLRMVAPEVAAGALFAFIFVVSEHGVPEFLTVKGKSWLTYAEGIFSRWNLRMEVGDQVAVSRATIASLPLVATIAVALWFALELRARTTITGDFRPLPIRRLGRWRLPALLVPGTYLGLGVALPVYVLVRWTMGSTRRDTPLSLDLMARSFYDAASLTGDDLLYTAGVGSLATLIVVLVALPLALAAARGRRSLEFLPVAAIAVPGILLALGMVKVFNRAVFGDFYYGAGMLACAYGARFLPFAVLTLSQLAQRVPRELHEAALLSGRSTVARTRSVTLRLLAPGIWSAACLVFILALRELDMAVILPGGNDTVVRRLSNVVHYGGEEQGGALALMLLLMATLVPVVTILVTGRKLQSLS